MLINKVPDVYRCGLQKGGGAGQGFVSAKRWGYQIVIGHF